MGIEKKGGEEMWEINNLFFGTDFPWPVTDAYSVIKKFQNTNIPPVYLIEIFFTLFYHFTIKDWQKIANIITAITANSPDQSYLLFNEIEKMFTCANETEYQKWLEENLDVGLRQKEISEIIDNGLKTYRGLRCQNPVVLNSEFICGLILGVFQSINWLNHKYQKISKAEKDFPEFIKAIILTKTVPEKFEYPKKFEVALASSIREYVQFSANSWVKKEELIKEQLIVLFEKISSASDECWPLPKLNQLILDKLNYAIFSSLEPRERANVIYGYLKD